VSLESDFIQEIHKMSQCNCFVFYISSWSIIWTAGQH